MEGQASIRARVRAFGVLGSVLSGEGATVTGPGPVTVGRVLESICSGQSDLARALLTEQGDLQPGVQVFVNGLNVRHAQGLDTAVPDGAEVLLLRGDVVGG